MAATLRGLPAQHDDLRPPMSRHFTFTEGSRLVRVRCYLHDDTHAAEGWYPPAERMLEFSKPFYWS